MADGQVLIDSKLDSGGVKKGTKEIEKEFSQTVKTVRKSLDAIEKAAKNIDVDNVADGMSESFEAEGREIAQVLEETSTEARESANEISNAYERAANEQASAMREAWAKTRSESASGSRKVISDLDDIGDKAQSVGGGLSSSLAGAFKSIAGAAAVYFGAEEIIEAGLGAINAAADVRAENAQFTQTFKELESTATQSLNSISKQTGITASRMKKSYTGIYAFSKSVGADSTQALDISNRAMLAAADSAAYFDMSLEDTTDRIRSFLKGNYEAGDALNVAATETTRNAKANEMYAKSFDKLTEAQKVDVLLAMVEAANEASGALGQAARESDAWANVTGELKEAWRQFTAVIGEPIMDTVSPILQNVTGALKNLTEKAKDFKISDLFGDVDLGPITTAFDALRTSAGNLATTIGGGLKTVYTDVLVPLGTWKIEESLPSMISALAAAFDALNSVLEYLAPVGQDFMNNILIPLGEFAGGAITGFLEGVTGAFQAISDVLNPIKGDVEEVADSVTSAAERSVEAAATAKQTNVERFADAADEIGSSSEAIADGWETSMSVIETSGSDTAEQVGEKFQETAESAEGSFAEMKSSADSNFAAMRANAISEINAIQVALDSLQPPTLVVHIVESDSRDHGDGGGTLPGTSAYTPAAYVVTPEIPYLATGAVIPPNAPFYAVLGDQKHGTNIEAPLETIKQAVAEVIGSGWDVTTTVNFEGTMAQFVRQLYPEIRSEVSRRGGSLAQEVVM